MVKALISALLALTIIVTGSALETFYVQKTLSEINVELTALYSKVESETATEESVSNVKEQWFKKKEMLHSFIPHNEIKEVDLWISETETLVKNKEYKDALSKINVCIQLTEQISKTFSLRIENIL